MSKMYEIQMKPIKDKSNITKKDGWKFKLNENQSLTLNQFLQNTS